MRGDNGTSEELKKVHEMDQILFHLVLTVNSPNITKLMESG